MVALTWLSMDEKHLLAPLAVVQTTPSYASLGFVMWNGCWKDTAQLP